MSKDHSKRPCRSKQYPSVTEEQLSVSDKRSVAVHEAGHVTVASALFCDASAFIKPSSKGNLTTELLWTGQAQYRHPIGGPDGAAISVAGIVAEALDEGSFDGDDDANCIAYDVVDCWEGESFEPSTTDYIYIPDSRKERYLAVVRAVEILREESRMFSDIVDRLLRDGYVSNGEVRDLYDEIHC